MSSKSLCKANYTNFRKFCLTCRKENYTAKLWGLNLNFYSLNVNNAKEERDDQGKTQNLAEFGSQQIKTKTTITALQ
jgi:hypothetical protein